MAEEAEIQVPGTKSKLPTKWLLIGGLVVVGAFIFLSKGGGDNTAGDGMLSSELDQRLQEQWDAIQNALQQSKQQGDTTEPMTPPDQPVEPTPITVKSTKGSKTPWRRGSGTTAGIVLPNENPLGQPANVGLRPPNVETLYVPTFTETPEAREARLLEHEARSPTRSIVSTPVVPRETPAQRATRLKEHEKRSPTRSVSIKPTTSMGTRVPKPKPHEPAQKPVGLKKPKRY